MAVSTKLNDEELAVAVRARDKELYAEIILRYETKLAHYLRKYIRSGDELDDVLQETFIKAYRNLFDFDENRRFSPWIYRIAHNEAINHLKKYRKEIISIEPEELEIVDSKLNLAEKVDGVLAKEKIERALSQLKNKYRDPLVLYFFEQKSYEEISDILHLPISTVGVLIMRGKEILKKYLI
ncbi:MAG: hypothetical protein A3J93_03905 [Candidatus Magasanikbacteria bacterium RIFOXYC2_FULL_42_28]|uniref:RNA polymerase sigma factor n=1 Tax=Candidatus Magasanikbacteria bacterium RIFOXYC2_FULL_42_28 TaxID=1798704 RepID=A0A1F6NUM0_9BACT|nr:MAG: hypothetical protein A3J93_03905 [Candidatus Magasanikbacteria bacterium RIFOXYC2_FULL_42_28]